MPHLIALPQPIMQGELRRLHTARRNGQSLRGLHDGILARFDAGAEIEPGPLTIAVIQAEPSQQLVRHLHDLLPPEVAHDAVEALALRRRIVVGEVQFGMADLPYEHANAVRAVSA